ncbi:MAG: TROVE domain-containing protein [Candidatus Bathyarchaeota archaeon]|nr:TROVE domain-containing protein [Candidatus Bathyarchaeota archaeon]
MDYRQHYSTKKTDQKEKIPGTTQVKNSAGGFAWEVTDWTKLERFLTLGTDGGTYYVGEHKLTVEAAEAVARCLKEDGPRTVRTIVGISVEGRAPKNDPALFALAMASSVDDPATRKLALAAIPKVARIGTHLFHYLNYVEGFRGWGRGLREAIADWYNKMPIDKLEYQAIKYRARDGWSHRDALRLSHPVAPTDEHQALYHWITQGKIEGEVWRNALKQVTAFEKAQKADEKEIVKLIEEFSLPREAIPTEHLKSAKIWNALFDVGMPMTAMVRNLGNMTRLGVLKPLGKRSKVVAERLADIEQIKKARVHPLSFLVALKTYASGEGLHGSNTWEPVGEIVDALDGAFYLAFQAVEPTNKRIVLALDVSGSMGFSVIAGMPITPREGATAMALVTKATEKVCTVMAFSGHFVPFPITERERLDDVVRKTERLPFDRTDCALPMLWATKKGIEADAFVIYTDNETWAGDIHPAQALQQYRNQTGIPAKLIVVGMVSNGFSIADPNDGGMLDVVGFDTATPNIISQTIR